MAPQSSLVPGWVAEYRDDTGKLLGAMTGVTSPEGDMLLQHVMLWPGVPLGTLPRMLRVIERRVWEEVRPRRIFLDVERAHPGALALQRMALRHGFRYFHEDDNTTWYVKESAR